jgi:hypothetical protein
MKSNKKRIRKINWWNNQDISRINYWEIKSLARCRQPLKNRKLDRLNWSKQSRAKRIEDRVENRMEVQMSLANFHKVEDILKTIIVNDLNKITQAWLKNYKSYLH